MAKSIKVKAGEDLSSNNIEKVKKILEDGGTKKSACGVLGIAYNTKRLATIIEEHDDQVAFEKAQRARKRGKPVDDVEASLMIEQYLAEGSMESVAKSQFRSVAIVKATLLKHGALLRSQKTDYWEPILIPDECVRTDFSEGQYVWSARYNTPAKIDKIISKEVYRIWLLGDNEQTACQPVEELGGLEHLENIGVKFSRVIDNYVR